MPVHFPISTLKNSVTEFKWIIVCLLGVRYELYVFNVKFQVSCGQTVGLMNGQMDGRLDGLTVGHSEGRNVRRMYSRTGHD